MRMKLRLPLLAVWATCLGTPALAHDTWFERQPATAGEVLLSLGTGNQYPRHESGIDARYLVRQGCRVAAHVVPLKPVRNEPDALVLRGPAGAGTCWAQLEPFDITLEPAKIELYLREIGAGPAVRASWAAMQQRGLPWRERYTKHARIELGEPSPAAVALGMDIVIDSGSAVAGRTIAARVLRDGQPVAGLPVELRSEDSALGIWRRTDDAGRLQVPAPAAGRWLLRATDLRPAADDPDRWESRFATLAFDIGTAPDQNGSSLTSNARSTNQAAANAAISNDPANSTPRR